MGLPSGFLASLHQPKICKRMGHRLGEHEQTPASKGRLTQPSARCFANLCSLRNAKEKGLKNDDLFWRRLPFQMKASQCEEDFPHQRSCLPPLYLASRRNAHKFRVDGGAVLGKVLVCLFPPSWHLFLRPLYHEYHGLRARKPN